MARIVMVHGIAQEQKSADTLEAEWLPNIAGGLRNAGHGALADAVIDGRRSESKMARMAFYGDLFLIPDIQGAGAGLGSEDSVDAWSEQYALACLEAAAKRSSNTRDQVYARAELGVREKVDDTQGPRSILRSAVAAAAELGWFAPLGFTAAERFNRSLGQVRRYFRSDEIRAEALSRVHGLIDRSTVALVGHSLGSVVAFEAAHRARGPIPLLLTLGSPIGLRNIVYDRLRPQPPSFPVQVQRWFNVADRDDLVAAVPDLTPLFEASRPPESTLDASATVDNGSQPHSANFYLTKALVGEALANALL